MKQFLSIFFSFLFAFQAHAGFVLERIDGTIWDQVERLRVPNNQLVKLGDKRYLLETGNENVLVNPNFQSSQVAQGWTYNPANFDLVKLDDTYAYTGTHSLQLDLKQGNFTDLELISQTYPAGYKLGGSDLEASIRIAKSILDPAVTLKWCASVDSVIVNCVTIPSLPASTSFQKYSVAFASKPGFATTYKVGLYATYNVVAGAVGVLALADASLKPSGGISSSATITYLGTAAGTISSDTGTITAGNYTVAAKNWRAADRLRHEVNITFTGTPGTWTVLNYTLPAGFVIDSSKMNSTTPAVAEVGNGSLIGSPNIIKIYYLTTTRVRPRIFTVSGSAVVGGDITSTQVSSGTVITFALDVPIQGWNDTNIVTPETGANLLGTHFYTREPQCPVNSVSDNATITRAQYPALFAKWQIAAGTDTLALANAGLVIRSTGTQTFGGKTYTATLNQKRNDAVESHTHTVNLSSTYAGGGTFKPATPNGTSTGTMNTGSFGSGTETHGPDIAHTGCYWAVANPFLPISGLVVSSDASASGRSEVVNTNRTVTSNTTLTFNDSTIFSNTTSAALTHTLPPAASAKGKQFHFVHTSSSPTNPTVIDGAGAETVCGLASIKMLGQNDSVTIESNGTGWFALNDGCNRTVSLTVMTPCTATPCTITRQSHPGVFTAPTRAAAGDYNLWWSNPGSAPPSCNIQTRYGGVGAFGFATLNSDPSTTVQTFRTLDHGGVDRDNAFIATCTFPR